jgi:hypothetical protein
MLIGVDRVGSDPRNGQDRYRQPVRNRDDPIPSPSWVNALVLVILAILLGMGLSAAARSAEPAPSARADGFAGPRPVAIPESSQEEAVPIWDLPWMRFVPLADASSTEGAGTDGWAVAASVPDALRLEATYDVSLRLDWDTRRVRLRTLIEVRNTTERAFEHLDLNTVVGVLGSLRGLAVTVDGAPVRARARGQTIRVHLPGGLAVGDEATIRVAFRARLRTTSAGRSFFWTQTGGVAQLYRFIPWVSRRIPFGTIPIGEPFLTAVSPMVRLSVHSDRALVWASSGERVSKDGRRETFVARDVRDMAVAASPGYRIRRGRSVDGRVDIVVYTRRTDAGRLLRLARQELARHQRTTGVRYPYPSYRVAESGGGLAMESPGLVWIPGSRGPLDLPFLVSHETAHQWFYGLVGNDQATDAFADEALAEYLSRKSRGVLRSSRCRVDRLDRRIFDYGPGCYYEVIYVQGALFPEKLRRDFGDGPFRRAIRAYARDHHLGIGSNHALLEAFRAEMGERVVRRFRARFPSLY